VAHFPSGARADTVPPAKRTRHTPTREDRTLRHPGMTTMAAPLLVLLAVAAAESGPQPRQAIVQAIPGISTRLTFVPVPGGRVRTDGDTAGEVVAPFWMSATEIPWEVYDIYAFALDDTPEEHDGTVDGVSRPTRPYGAAGRGFGHDGYAALGMTYHAAEQFAVWFSQTTDRPYRVPTESEWTLACRTRGDMPLQRSAWTRGTAFDGPQRVGSKEPNPLGLYDMLGNVAEWVSGADGVPSVRGGSYRDRSRNVDCHTRQIQEPAWNARDPQIPKSRWWLSDAPFVGIRLVTDQE